MIRKTILLASALALGTISVQAGERYRIVRPVIIESGIAGEWMTQLSGPVRPHPRLDGGARLSPQLFGP